MVISIGIRQDFYGSWCSPFFGIRWVISELVRETLPRWHGSFADRRRIKAWRAAPCIFWTIWKERNKRYFDCEELLDQRLKNIFLNNFFVWLWVYIDGGYSHLVDFIDWLGCGWGRSTFLYPLFCFCLILLVYGLCTHMRFLRFLIIKKKKF